MMRLMLVAMVREATSAPPRLSWRGPGALNSGDEQGGPAMATRNWQVKRLSAALGAEVTGVRLADADAGEAADIRRLLHENFVLFFPGQHMSAEAHIAFGRHFGQLEGHPNLKDNTPQEHPELFRLVASQGGIADEWHTDLTFLERPA